MLRTLQRHLSSAILFPWRAVVCALLAVGLPAEAQRPVPKAVPIDEGKPTEAGRAPAVPPPRAEVLPETDAEPAPRPRPATEPSPRPAPSRPAPVPPPPASPKSPEDDLFDFCELCFQRGSYAQALQNYDQYLNTYPQGKYREEARFKMGECYYKSEAWDQALREFENYLREYPSGRHRAIVLFHTGESHYRAARRVPAGDRGPHIQRAYDAYRNSLQTAKSGLYACLSAHRLGSFSYNAARDNPQLYRDAARWFAMASAQAPKDQQKIRVEALYFAGRSHRHLKSSKEAAAAFNEVIKIKADNQYYDKAWLELAQIDLEAGRNAEAMKKFEHVARETAEAETRADSLVNAGMIHADAGRSGEAIAKFEEALKVSGEKAKSPRARARFGLVWSSFKAKAYEKVLEAWRGLQGDDYADLDEYSRARLWLIVGTAYAAVEKHALGAQTLKLLENLVDSPSKQVLEACLEGGYKRIVSLFKLNDPHTPEAVDDFVRMWKDRQPESAYLDKAWLAKGAWYFNRSIWDAAGRAYKSVRVTKLEAEKTATYFYQRGCAEAASGDREAVSTLTLFLEKNGSDPRAMMARLQRGLARLKAEDLNNALKDFQEVAAKAGKSEAGESASYHTAKILGMKRDYAGMVTAFRKLLADYPKTPAAAEANFWIGNGLYQQKQYKDCIEPFRKARTQDAKTYFEDASQLIIWALLASEDTDGLVLEVDAYLKVQSNKPLDPAILKTLGMKLFRERRDYERTARFLTYVVTRDDPAKTEPDVWQACGESLLETREYVAALQALDSHLKVEERKPQRARSFLLRGRAFLAQSKLDEAGKSVEEGLTIDRETLIAAQLHMLSGDIADRAGRREEALSSYNNVRVTWEDPVLTPTSITKMIALLVKDGTPAKLKQAADLEAELKKRYPKFQVARKA